MGCYHPIPAFKTADGSVVFSALRRHGIVEHLQIACGQCIGCRMRRAADWELRVMHEASMWPSNCFVTLTYSPEHLPPGGTLRHRDFQLFMKRLRRFFRTPVRFYMCGEYGPLNLRPHYHACLFNVDFSFDRVPSGKSSSSSLFYSSPTLSSLWPLGVSSVQPLVTKTAGYCARYILKKVLGAASKGAYERVDADGVIYSVAPEYAAMSLKPGVGANWFDRYERDVFPADFVVADGVKRPPPKYYDKLYERKRREAVDDVEFARQKRAMLSPEDKTSERLRVREQVHLARLSTLKRSLEP